MPRKRAPTYEGTPCRVCSSTTRYQNGAHVCVACAQARAREPKNRAATKEWLRNTEAGRESVRRGNRARYLRDKEKCQAREKVRYRWKKGYIPKPTDCICAHCNAQAQEYHHEDYSKPLDVIPLCKPCHIKRHATQEVSSEL